jgi:hypothetical protein
VSPRERFCVWQLATSNWQLAKQQKQPPKQNFYRGSGG